MTDLMIKAQKTIIDPRFLDRIGTSFRFDHAKGLAEWLKNSVDAYIREDTPDSDQFIFLKFSSKTKDRSVRFECIDFVGMTHQDIEKAFKRWGDPDAANRRGKYRTYGGHGNGGKFYMRQMFDTSRFVTYRNGRLNIFGFNEKKRYGFAQGYENLKVSPKKALELAGISNIDYPDNVKKRLDSEGPRFTVVIGEAPKKMRGRNTVPTICQRLQVHPQSRKIIEHEQVFTLIDDQKEATKLEPAKINPRPDFVGPYEIPMPAKLVLGSSEIDMASEKYVPGKLVLRTSEEPFARYGERASLNCVDILAGVGCVASYRMNELGFFRYPTETEFIYGECYCPILEDPEEDSISNDREKLVDNERTKALIEWIRTQVDELGEKMAVKSADERKAQDLKQSSVFNDLLNRWKNKFMEKLYAELFSGPGSGPGAGGTGGGGSPVGGKGHGDRSSGGEDGSGGGGADGEKKSRAPRFPRVLLSNKDDDPLNPGNKVNCDPRHPPVYQRHDDLAQGIYWINTTAPFAEKILKQYTADSVRWREYLFQRYVDIITKQTIYEKAKKEPDMTASMVDVLLDDVAKRVYTAAADELYNFLFKEQLSPGSVMGESVESA